MRLFSFFTLLLLTACTPTVETNPPKDLYDTDAQVIVEVNIARIEHQTWSSFEIAPTGSMEPFLHGGYFVMVDRHFPFEKLKKDDIILYFARWYPGNEPVCHRINAGSAKEGFITSGDHNTVYERGKYAVTEDIYYGKVVKVIGKK